MKMRLLLGTAVAAGAVIVLGQIDVVATNGGAGGGVDTFAPGPDGTPIGLIGPDVIVGALPTTVKWSTDATETSYSIATTSCNIGDQDLDWVSSPSVHHPVIGQNLFRLKDGRFEHIGQSWLKHSFCALQLPLGGCGSCSGPGGCLSRLTPGCSDPYSATRNGSQNGLGPKWEVNAHTGEFNVPWAQGEGTSGEFRRRLRVFNDDVNPALNPGAKYFIEGHYVTLDDAAFDNRHNNASYRQVTVNPGSFSLVVTGATLQQKEAIKAWKDFDSEVVLTEVFVSEQDADGGTSDAKFVIGQRAYDNGDGTYDYEYAIYNMNSHRSMQAFTVPTPGLDVTDVGWHGVRYHSGEAWDSTPWDMATTLTAVTWTTDTYASNNNANALRWGTIYNYRFTADSPPTQVDATMTLFRPGTPSEMTVSILGPEPGKTGPCMGDFDGSGDVGFSDLTSILAFWQCTTCPEYDLDMSGTVDFADLIGVLSAWGDCP